MSAGPVSPAALREAIEALRREEGRLVASREEPHQYLLTLELLDEAATWLEGQEEANAAAWHARDQSEQLRRVGMSPAHAAPYGVDDDLAPF